MSSMLLPFVLPFFMDRAGLRATTLCFAAACVAGQWVFILGLEQKSYELCLIS